MLNYKLLIMRKLLLSIAATLAVLPAFAGGLMTNTNQSAAFLRSIARGTTLDSDAVYYNPAGTVFMKDGWHIGISDQMALQTRSTTSTFAPFKMGANNNGSDTKEFKGSVFSALIPSFHLTWKKNRWAVMFGIGVNGGGGTIKYPGGLASFERQFSAIPLAITQMGSGLSQMMGQSQPMVSANQYSMDMLLKGNSMTLAFNVGGAFRITKWLSAAIQLRVGYTSNGYTGYIKNIMTNPTAPAFGLNGDMMRVDQFMGMAATALKGQLDEATEGKLNDYKALTGDHILNVKQTGFSVSPIIALAFHYDKWDASIRYEFEMNTKLKTKSAAVSANDPVINAIFPNGKTVKAETPALLAVAASRWCGPVKISLGWNHYFDKQAQNSFSESNVVRGNTNEYLAGVEWQINKRWLVSAGAQRTQFNLKENNYSDMNFSISAWSVGLGFAVNIIENIRLNAGFMYTIYDKGVTSIGTADPYALQYATAMGMPDADAVEFATPKDVYKRTSLSWGIGLDLYFGKRK